MCCAQEAWLYSVHRRRDNTLYVGCDTKHWTQEARLPHPHFPEALPWAGLGTVYPAKLTAFTAFTRLAPDFRITPAKSGFNTVRLHWRKTGICSVLTLGASLGLIIFTVLIRKSEKHRKVLRDCLKNLLMGLPSGHQTVPRGWAPRESLMTLRNSLGQIYQETPADFPLFVPTSQKKKIHLWLDLFEVF